MACDVSALHWVNHISSCRQVCVSSHMTAACDHSAAVLGNMTVCSDETWLGALTYAFTFDTRSAWSPARVSLSGSTLQFTLPQNSHCTHRHNDRELTRLDKARPRFDITLRSSFSLSESPLESYALARADV
jgi:hypothetical protein